MRVAAFTLIELMVVIAIIALLFAALLPALSQARGQVQAGRQADAVTSGVSRDDVLNAIGAMVSALCMSLLLFGRLASLSGSLENAEAGAAKTIPAARLGRPEEMAWAAAFLASNDAKWITGELVRVAGARR